MNNSKHLAYYLAEHLHKAGYFCKDKSEYVMAAIIEVAINNFYKLAKEKEGVDEANNV